jgi:hypothetical protein
MRVMHAEHDIHACSETRLSRSGLLRFRRCNHKRKSIAAISSMPCTAAHPRRCFTTTFSFIGIVLRVHLGRSPEELEELLPKMMLTHEETREIVQTKHCGLKPFSLSIQSRTYAGQFSSFVPSDSQRFRYLTASRSAHLRSRKSRMMFRYLESRSLFSSGTCSDSMCPLRTNTVKFSRTDLSISQGHRCHCDALHCLGPLADVSECAIQRPLATR